MNSLYVKQALQRQRFISAHFQAPVAYFGCYFHHNSSRKQWTTLGETEANQSQRLLWFYVCRRHKNQNITTVLLGQNRACGSALCVAAWRRCLFTVIQVHCECNLFFTVDTTASQECFHTPAQVPGRFSDEDRDTFSALSPPWSWALPPQTLHMPLWKQWLWQTAIWQNHWETCNWFLSSG